jgi:hypothetical protein
LESVGGYLSIHSSAKLDALKSVGGYLSIYSSAKLDAPQVGERRRRPVHQQQRQAGRASTGERRRLPVHPQPAPSWTRLNWRASAATCPSTASAKLDALKSVGGDLSINSSAKLDAPQLESVGGDLYIREGATLTAGKLYTGGYDKFKVIDSIGCVVLSTKQSNGFTILSCRHSKIKNQKVVGDKFYVAQKDGHNAHGKTIEEAVRELQFKTGNRDVSQWNNLDPKTAKTPDEWAFVYRMITGACQYGTKDFMSRQKLKKKYTLAEILAATKGAYGHDTFKSVVGAS